MTAIQKAREELRGQLVLLHSLANDTTEANWRDKRLYILQTCVRMSDALAALDAETEVKVRDLEWKLDDSAYYARPTSGPVYTIQRFHDGWDLLINGSYVKPYIAGYRETYTVEAAKADAQADYERRIHSALVPPESRS